MGDIFKEYYEYYLETEVNGEYSKDELPYDLAVMLTGSGTSSTHKAYKAGILIPAMNSLVKGMTALKQMYSICTKLEWKYGKDIYSILYQLACANFSFVKGERAGFYESAFKFVVKGQRPVVISTSDRKYNELNGVLLGGIDCLFVKDTGRLRKIVVITGVRGSLVLEQFERAMKHYCGKRKDIVAKCTERMSCSIYAVPENRTKSMKRMYQLVDEYAKELCEIYNLRT